MVILGRGFPQSTQFLRAGQRSTGPQTIAVGQAIEDEEAQAVGKAKKRRIGSKTLTESFNKSDGALGPDLTWTRRVFTNSHPLSVVSNRARMTVSNDAGTYEDLQEPSPNVDDPNGNVLTVEVPAVSHTGASGDFVADGAGVLRFATHTGGTDYRGYAFGFGLNNVFFPPATTYHLGLFRIDAVGNSTLLGLTISATSNVTLPATVTAWAVDDRLNIIATHGGPGPPLVLFGKDATYSDGIAVWGGSVQAAGTDISTVEFDNWSITWPSPVEENELAQLLGKSKLRILGQATESEVAQVITVVKTRVLTQAIESELSQAINEVKSITLGQGTETELAQAVGKTKTLALSQAVETELAQQVGAPRKVNQAVEIEAAQVITAVKTSTIGQSAETELSQSVGKTKSRVVSQSIEIELAQTIVAPLRLNQAIEVEQAFTITGLKARVVGQSIETELAQLISRIHLITLGAAQETETASAIAKLKRSSFGQTTETELAQTIAAIKTGQDLYPHKVSYTEPSYVVAYVDASYSIPSLESGGIVGYVEPDVSVDYTDYPSTVEYVES